MTKPKPSYMNGRGEPAENAAPIARDSMQFSAIWIWFSEFHKYAQNRPPTKNHPNETLIVIALRLTEANTKSWIFQSRVGWDGENHFRDRLQTSITESMIRLFCKTAFLLLCSLCRLLRLAQQQHLWRKNSSREGGDGASRSHRRIQKRKMQLVHHAVSNEYGICYKKPATTLVQCQSFISIVRSVPKQQWTESSQYGDR